MVQQQQQQQHRIYILQFRKGEPEQEVACKVSQPKGSGRRVMYYYQDYGGGGGKSGKPAQSARGLSLRRILAMLFFSFLCVGTLLVAPVSFLSFVHTDDGGAEAAAATAARGGGVPGPCSAVGNDSLCCDRTSERADICFARGDLRMHSTSSSFLLVSGNNSTAAEEERIRPYTRKWEANVMATIDEVRLRRVSPSSGDAAAAAPKCDVRHDVPALLFSTGGYTGNVYHEFNDGILPLFVTAGHLRRRVVLVILEYHDWWITKYGDVVSQLSEFPPVDFTADRRVHCFPEVIAGLRIHGELTVDPARTPEGRGIADFRRLLDDAYRGRIEFLDRLERRAARKRHRRGVVLPRAPPRRAASGDRPRLVIVSRTGSRVIENEAEVAAMAGDVGFDVRVIRPDRTTELCKIYKELNASDAMVGVHGAAMTHFLFMRQNVRLDLTRFREELVRAHQYLAAGRRRRPRAPE
ncbi:unnamed protein product [Urochloa decumbens]|uniref:Glycosyltransferase 61 catalytic domain-containing protein n=1 Tax=Urochloa decumbens TaxID=240449 RepID=A0ABC9FAX4_9POAL